MIVEDSSDSEEEEEESVEVSNSYRGMLFLAPAGVQEARQSTYSSPFFLAGVAGDNYIVSTYDIIESGDCGK